MLSVQRQEKKFVLTIDVAKKIAWEFEQVLKPDIHNGWDGYRSGRSTSIRFGTAIMWRRSMDFSSGGKCGCAVIHRRIRR